MLIASSLSPGTRVLDMPSIPLRKISSGHSDPVDMVIRLRTYLDRLITTLVQLDLTCRSHKLSLLRNSAEVRFIMTKYQGKKLDMSFLSSIAVTGARRHRAR